MVNYIADGVFSDTNEHLLDGVPVVAKVLCNGIRIIRAVRVIILLKGEKMDGQFFPVVHNPYAI